MASFNDLPDELVLQIVYNIDSNGDLGNLSLVCRRLRSWIQPDLRERFEMLKVDGSVDDGQAAGIELQKQLLQHLSAIVTCPSLRWFTKSAYIGFVAYADVKQWRCDNLELGLPERRLARDTLAIASRRAGFASRGSSDEDNLDFMTGLALILAPNLEEVKVDFANITLCQFLSTVAGFRCVQDALPGDASMWARR